MGSVNYNVGQATQGTGAEADEAKDRQALSGSTQELIGPALPGIGKSGIS